MTDLPLLEPSTGDPSAQTTDDPGAARRPRHRRVLIAVLSGIVVVSMTLPATVAGLTLDDGDNAKQTAEYLRTAVAAKIDLDDSVGGVYRDPASRDQDVMIFGGTHLMLNPAKDLDQAFSLLNDSSGQVSDLHEVPAGPRGGVMKCGMSTSDGGSMPVCGWADRDSLALALFPGRSVDQSAQLLREMRAGIEHTG
jgi:hypothetical protein